MYSYQPYDSFASYARPAASMEFIQGLEKAIDGEYSAITCYEQLVRMAPSQEQKNIINEIRNDEIRHYNLFTQLYTRLTGRQHTPKMTEMCANEYQQGLLMAFKDEQETVDFYNMLSDQAPDMATRDILRRVAADEQQHAVWFLSFMTMPKAF